MLVRSRIECFFVFFCFSWMVELVEERLCHAVVWLFQNLPDDELLVFNKSVDMILSSMFTCGNLKYKRYTEQGLLGVAVRHHLRGKGREM